MRYFAEDDQLTGTSDGLYRVRSSEFGRAFLKPGAQLSGYEAVMIDPVTISYGGPPQERSPNGSGRNVVLSDESMEHLKRLFDGILERELARVEGLAVVSEAGPNTLRVSPRISDLSIYAPFSGPSEMWLVSDLGEMTLLLDIRDAQTQEPLLRVADHRDVRPMMGALVDVQTDRWGDFRGVFITWSWLAAIGIGDLRELAEIPNPEWLARGQGEAAFPSADSPPSDAETGAMGTVDVSARPAQ